MHCLSLRKLSISSPPDAYYRDPAHEVPLPILAAMVANVAATLAELHLSGLDLGESNLSPDLSCLSTG